MVVLIANLNDGRGAISLFAVAVVRAELRGALVPPLRFAVTLSSATTNAVRRRQNQMQPPAMQDR